MICENLLKGQDHRMFAYLDDRLEFERVNAHYMEKILRLYFYLDKADNNDKNALEHYMLRTQLLK